jgi:hypothetical protein
MIVVREKLDHKVPQASRFVQMLHCRGLLVLVMPAA